MPRSSDTILGHCIARAVIHEHGGVEAAAVKYGPNAERLSKWDAIMTAARVTPKASRVAAFIVCWALGMWDEKLDSFSIIEYQRYWNESERKAYRVQNEFRELWPEFDTPNELAAQMVATFDARTTKKDAAKLPTTLRVLA